MSFIVNVVAKMLEWVLVVGGTYLYDKAKELIEKNKQKKIDEKNLANLIEAIKQKDRQKELDLIRDIANGG